jgi:hypothetical protein
MKVKKDIPESPPEKPVIKKIKKPGIKKESFKVKSVRFISSAFKYLMSKYNRIKIILINHKAQYSDKNINAGRDNSGDDKDIQSYIDRAKKLSKKIKKF